MVGTKLLEEFSKSRIPMKKSKKLFSRRDMIKDNTRANIITSKLLKRRLGPKSIAEASHQLVLPKILR